MMEIQQNLRRWSWMKHWHRTLVFDRRTRVLSEALAAQIPRQASVLDIGCGDGTIGSLIARLRPDIKVDGVEVMARPECKIPCQTFDGTTLPLADNSFDVCMLVDVLHHTEDARILLREASRVSRSFVLIKDHLDENFLDNWTLRFMDWVGNRPHGVRLTYNYQSRSQWSSHFSECGLQETSWTTQIPLYTRPIHLVAGRGLHFISLLRKGGQRS
jgi:SAM-dependent methyltransferase